MKEYAIILAADLPTPEQVMDIVKKTGRIVDGIKIGVATLLEAGIGIVSKIRDLVEDNPILIDLKIADIGVKSASGWSGTNSKILAALKDSGATHVTAHGFPGPVSIAEAVGAAEESGIDVLLLPLMSHAAAGLFFGRPLDKAEIVKESEAAGLSVALEPDASCSTATEGILLLGEALGVAGYIGPATRPDDLRIYRSFTHKPIWCPGFGRQDRLGRGLDKQFSDWAEIVGPASAAIVGSAIFKAEDPASAATEIVEIRDEVVG